MHSRRCLEAVTRASGLTAARKASLPYPVGAVAAVAAGNTEAAPLSRMAAESDGDSPLGSREPSPSRTPQRGTPTTSRSVLGGGRGGGGKAGGGGGSGAVTVYGEEHRLTGHSGTVMALAATDSGLLFSGSTDCTIKVRAWLSICCCWCCHCVWMGEAWAVVL